jgi:secreted trypsin-like serine protease
MMKTFVIFLVICACAFADVSFKPLGEYSEYWGTNSSGIENIGEFIVGGQNAGVHQVKVVDCLHQKVTNSCDQFPFHVAVISELFFGNSLCSGSLISRQSVLTSAMCVSGAISVTLHLGARDLNVDERYHVRLQLSATSIRIHPGFSRQHRVLRNDVAIVRLTNPIGFFPSAINIVNLPSRQLWGN